MQSIETLWKAGDDRLKFKRAAKERQVLELWQKNDREFRLKLVLNPFIKKFRIELLSFPIERFPQIGYLIAKHMLREYSPNFGELVWPNIHGIIQARMIRLKNERSNKE